VKPVVWGFVDRDALGHLALAWLLLLLLLL